MGKPSQKKKERSPKSIRKHTCNCNSAFISDQVYIQFINKFNKKHKGKKIKYKFIDQIRKGIHQGCTLSACLFNLHAKYKPSSSCCSQHSGFQVSGPVGRSCASFTLAPPPLLLTAPSQRTLNVLTEPEWDKVVKASAGELVGEEEEWISLRHYFTSDTKTRFSLV